MRMAFLAASAMSDDEADLGVERQVEPERPQRS